MPKQKKTTRHDSDAKKGGVEQDSPEQKANVAEDRTHVLSADQDVPNKALREGPEGVNVQPEVAGGDRPEANQGRPRDADADAEAELQDQDPGERQKRNQGEEKDDPLAA
ncbi:MAG TPA: hypothetical protein VN622_14960 [Clostridia bacterium]|nr:hypothetical protein [Clostridia bacterium]